MSYQIKMRVFHQNESRLACPHPPLSYEGRREQKGSSHFDRTLRYIPQKSQVGTNSRTQEKTQGFDEVLGAWKEWTKIYAAL